MENETAERNEIIAENSTVDFDKIEETNKVLEGRINFLKNTMEDLKDQIKLERQLWKKEVDHVNQMVQSTSASENKNISPLNMDGINAEPTLNDASLLDYEKKLSMYHEALVKSHIEKRMQLRRHLIANAYKRRLLEIENMCNVELLKVKQSVQNLQPLQAMVSEWNLDDEITGGTKTNKETEATEATSSESANKGNSEIKDIMVHNSPTRSSFDTTSSVMQEEDEDMFMIRRLQTMGWYNTDINYLGYNPYM